MKTAIVQIQLFQFNELNDEASTKAVNDHYYFLAEMGQEYENENGEMITEYYDPSEEEVINSIEINDYYFYNNGELANVTNYTGAHPNAGKTGYKHTAQTEEIFI